jgi:Flp pilus assembly protein TadG
LTEFALILPLLMLILLGIVDFGRVFYYWTSLANAAREGARYGVTHPSNITGNSGCQSGKADPNNVFYRVKQEAGTTIQLTDANVAVYYIDPTKTFPANTTDATACNLPADSSVYANPNSMRVDVTYDFRAFTPMISTFWGGGPLKIVSSASMVIE